MKRPLLVVGASSFFAVWFAFMCPEDASLHLSAAAALTAAVCFVLRGRSRWLFPACAAFLSASVAFAGVYLYIANTVVPLRALAGKSVVMEGLVASADRGPSATSYTMKVTFADYPGLDATVILRGAGEAENGEGDVLRLKARLLPAPDTIWYKSRGIYLIAMNGRNIESVTAGRYRFERALIRLRGVLERNLYSKLTERNAGIVSAMTLGLKGGVDSELYTAVSRSGTAHLLSISGLHLSILSGFLLSLLRKLRCPKPVSAILTVFACFLFAVTVGFGASVTRALAMTSVALLGRAFSRRGDSLNSMGLALLICTAVNPGWAVSWGLWLSAGSTAGIILFSDKLTAAFYERLKSGRQGLDRIIKAVSSGAAISVAAYSFTLPMLMLMSGWISLISPFANVLVAPFIPVTILGGIVCAVFPGSPLPVSIIARLTDFSTSVVISVSETLGRLPFAIAAADESWILIWLFGMCAFAAILVAFKADKKLLSYALALAFITFAAGELSHAAASRDKLELITLSGHNAAILLRQNEAVILGTPDAYEISNLMRYLDFRGVKRIPTVIAADSGDNVGSGLLRLASAHKIDCVIGPNDAFIVETLAAALPDSLVYSGGYAETGALGGAKITIDLQSGDINVRVGKNEIVKTRRECDIIKSGSGRTEIYRDGVLLLPPGVPPAFEPLGGWLFGESRVYFSF